MPSRGSPSAPIKVTPRQCVPWRGRLMVHELLLVERMQRYKSGTPTQDAASLYPRVMRLPPGRSHQKCVHWRGHQMEKTSLLVAMIIQCRSGNFVSEKNIISLQTGTKIFERALPDF